MVGGPSEQVSPYFMLLVQNVILILTARVSRLGNQVHISGDEMGGVGENIVTLTERVATLEDERLVDQVTLHIDYHCIGVARQEQVINRFQMWEMHQWRQDMDLRIDHVEGTTI